MSKVDREEIISLCGNSIELFGRLFLSKALSAATPAFHKKIYADLEDDSIKRLGIIAPRGHSKSTVTSVVYPIWRTIFKPRDEELMIVLISESQSQAINFLNIIKRNLANNQKILGTFGSLMGDKWTEEDITTSNGVRILAKGTGQRIRGMLSGGESITRPNLIILDDFESETNSGTPDAIAKNKDWITKAVEPSLADDGRLVAIGTIIDQKAYLMDIMEDPAWKTHYYQAAIGDDFNNPLWPERFPPQRLHEIYESYKRRGMEDAFWQEYQNWPVNKDALAFPRERFRYWDGEFRMIDKIQPALLLKKPTLVEGSAMLRPVNVTVGLDLAISEDHRADFTVILPLGMDKEENRFILPYRRIKSRDIDVIVNEALDVCAQYGAMRINIETVQFQQAVATAFRKAMMDRGMYLAIDETRPRTAKDARIRSLQPLFSAGKVYHQANMTELESELLNFPRAKHDDILDAFFMANMVATPADEGELNDGPLKRDEFKEVDTWLVL